MTDIYDQATAREEQERELALAHVRRHSKPALQHIGVCHNCGESLDAPKTFCDSDCRDDWQRRHRNK